MKARDQMRTRMMTVSAPTKKKMIAKTYPMNKATIKSQSNPAVLELKSMSP